MLNYTAEEKKKKKKRRFTYIVGIFTPKGDIIFLKNFFEILCPLFRFFAHYISERQNSSAQNGTSNRKELNKLEIPNAETLARKDLHILISETISTAKKVYLHYTPSGAMIVKILF